jgi:dTDP-4-dehydrorhamnose reductase
MQIMRHDLRDLELWGGIECSVNRVGDAYMDQLQLNGHDRRAGDLQLFAELGISKIRYPVLWERTAPRGPASADWRWSDDRLHQLKTLEVTPIVGLVHHGSGPISTRLDHESFVTGLVEFAGAVAKRYPWLEYYCPVNEPLTTARFSGLYGHWFPHGKNSFIFAKALLNQCRATVLAMRAIREINPLAKLVQTEDLGKTYSASRLAYQAEFENERRWITFDLLTGQLGPESSMWKFLRSTGIKDEELDWFRENPCPPDILGGNYYVVSERVLDDRLYLYPQGMHGGNGRDGYVDVEAVRVRGIELAGWRGLLNEAWERYHLPLAMTEVHLHCHREDQVEWFREAWDTAQQLRHEGIDLRAVTAWSLLGSYNWNSLLTRNAGHYEPGAYELGNSEPRPTALSRALRQIASERQTWPTFVRRQGWWRNPDRFVYPSILQPEELPSIPTIIAGAENANQPLLILGRRGMLGSAFAKICRERRLPYIACSRSDLDVTDRESIEQCLDRHKFWAVVNAAGYVGIDDAEHDPVSCFRVNAIGAKNLAKICARRNIQLLTFSSDLVFDGKFDRPYVEEDAPAPLSIYGHSKAAAERRVLGNFPDALVVRTSAFFGPWDDRNFLTVSLERLSRGLPVCAADDWVVSPTYIPDLVHRCLDLLIDGESGIWHLANETALSWADFAELGASIGRSQCELVQRCHGAELGLPARRPAFSALGSDHGYLLPPLETALAHYHSTRKASRETPIESVAL